MKFNHNFDGGDNVFIKSVELINNDEIDNIPLGFFFDGVFKYYSIVLLDNLKDINLTQRQCYILLSLMAKDMVHQEHIACVLNSNEATITRDINYLEKEGLIIRQSHDEDKRKKVVSLSSKGAKVYKILNDVNEQIVRDLSVYFNENEIHILKLFLKKMYLSLGAVVKKYNLE